MSSLPIVRNRTDIDTHVGERVQIIGHYIQIDVRKRPVPPPVYVGNVAIALDDGTKVLLHAIWSSKAHRPPAEITEFEGHRVIAVGQIFPTAPPSHRGAENLMMPCLFTVDSVVMA